MAIRRSRPADNEVANDRVYGPNHVLDQRPMGQRICGAPTRNLARPGGNVTGLSIQGAEITGKGIQLLREALHPLSRLAIMGNGDNSAVVAEMRETQAAAEKLVDRI